MGTHILSALIHSDIVIWKLGFDKRDKETYPSSTVSFVSGECSNDVLALQKGCLVILNKFVLINCYYNVGSCGFIVPQKTKLAFYSLVTTNFQNFHVTTVVLITCSYYRMFQHTFMYSYGVG